MLCCQRRAAQLTDTTEPYGFNWDTAGLSGSNKIVANAFDTAGQLTSTSSIVNVTASPPPPSAKPDLIVTDITWSPRSPRGGAKIRFSATIKNIGTVATPSGVKHGLIWIWQNGPNEPVVSWSDDSFDSLAPGESRTLTATGGHDGDPYWNDVRRGTHSITALIDDQNLFNEANETNNTFTKSLTVSGWE